MARMWRPVWRSVLCAVARKYQNADPGVAFNIADIYAAASGIWIDPSNISTLFQDAAASVPVAASANPVRRANDLSGSANNITASSDARRATYTEGGGLKWLEHDGTDDGLTAAAGGGASSGFLVVVAFRCDTLAASQILFDNRSANTGFQLTVNSALGRIDANAWNGAEAVGNATSGGSIVAGTDYVVSFWYDGTNTRVQVNSTAVATSAAVTLAAGPAGIGIGRTIAGGSYIDGRIYGVVYVKDSQPSEDEREGVKKILAAKAGVTL